MSRLAGFVRVGRGARAAAGVALACLAPAQAATAATVNAVENGTTTLAAAGAVAQKVTLPLAPGVDINKSFLVFGLGENTSDPRDGQVSGQLTNSTGSAGTLDAACPVGRTCVTFQRNDASSAAFVKWYVAEFSSGVRVLRGSANIGTGAGIANWIANGGNPPFDITLGPAVDTTKSFPLITLRVGGVTFDDNDFLEAKIIGGGTTLRLESWCACTIGDHVVEWQVVEYQGASVTSNIASDGTGDLVFAVGDTARTAGVSITDVNKAWLVYSYAQINTDAGTDIGRKLVRGRVTNTTTLTFDRNNTGVDLKLAWYLVQFTDGTSVRSGSESFAIGDGSKLVPIAAVEPGKALAVAGGDHQRGGRTPYAADDNPGVAWFRLELTSATELRISRSAVGIAAADVGWYVLSFSGCCGLATAETATTVTVTGAGQFEMRFNLAAGGGLDQFYDLVEDPGRAVDLAGGTDGIEALFSDAIEAGGGGIWYDNVASYAEPLPAGYKPRLDLLEATSARVRVRAESPYFREGTTGVVLPGVKAWSDYSVYPSGRIGYRLDRRTTAAVPYLKTTLNLGVHLAAAPLAAWTGYSQLGVLGSQLPTDTFGLFTTETAGPPGARTDFLQVPHRGWTLAGHTAAATEWARFDSGGEEYALVEWRSFAGATILANTAESWDFLTWFKPTTFVNNGDAAVTERVDDYRGPDPLSAIAPGAGWNENTADADFFNESEGAYTLDMNPASGLSFDMNGSTTTRHAPFFKIRQWRSLVEAPNVTLEGVPLRRDVDYKAAVKPLARAHKANSLSWHHTGQDGATVPEVGTAGGLVLGNGSIVGGRFGNGLSVATGFNDSYFSAPVADFSFGVGAIEFWYKPFYDSTTAGPRKIFQNIGGAVGDHDCFWLEHSGGNLVLRAYLSADNESCNTGGTPYFTITATAADYAWRANDWVHIRAEWDSNSYMRLRVNGTVVGSAGNYNVVPWTHGQTRIGSCQINCPGGGGSNNADGVIDEPHLYVGMGSSGNPETLGWAGLVSDSRESLASPSSNVALLSSTVGAGNKGQYVYFGADARFHGLNMAFATPGVGAGVAAGALVWQYWRTGGGTEGWTSLESVGGFADGTNDFKQNGTVKWDADPTDWRPYSVNGGPDLYYVRVYLSGFPNDYTTPPVEAVVKTDILLFQHCADVTAAAQTFAFAVPPTTEVTLTSFSATPGDSSVRLEWRTASELRNLGFHVYRGPAESGPWTRLTSSLIPGLGSSAVGQAYSFGDAGLANGTRYFYRLEDVDASSKATSHGPVSAIPTAAAATPGGAPAGEPAAGGSGGGGEGASATCPGWVIQAYTSSAGADADTASLRCTRHGAPEATSLGVVSRDARQATLELRTGGFYALHTRSGAGEPAGGVRVFVPGFDFPQDAQALALPMRRALVDAVVGRGVQLGGVRALEQQGFRGLVPSGLGQAEMRVGRDGTVRPSRRTASRHDARPASRMPRAESAAGLVTLLPSLFQGETKSAVVELRPLRFDARRQQLLLSKRLLVKLLFTGRAAAEHGRGSIGRAPGSRKPAAVSGEVLARLHSRERGLHAVSFEGLFPQRRRGFPVSELRLERQGEPVAFHVEPAGDGFGPGGRLFFFADRSAGSTEFAGELAYELVRSREGLRMPLVAGGPAGSAVETASLGSRTFEENKVYQPGLLEAQDLWQWQGLASGTTLVKSFTLAGVDISGLAELAVDLQGASESGLPVDHHVSVSVNGALVGEAKYAGKRPFRVSLSFAASQLKEGANELSLTNVGDTVVTSYVLLDRFTLAHPQLSSLAGGRFEGTWPTSGSVGLSTGGAVSGPVRVVDVTGMGIGAGSGTNGNGSGGSETGTGGAGTAGSAAWLTGIETTTGEVRFRVEAGHRYWVGGDSALFSPRVSQVQPSTLKSAVNQAAYLVIAPQAFLAAAEPLLARRQDQGLSVRAVAFEQIAAEFGHGQPSAEAIREFLRHAFHLWAQPSPRYVLLLGDASYDPRNFTGRAQPAPLPALWAKTSYMWTASDPQLAAVNGEDALPDLAIGRLPATTVAQAEALVQKLLAWEDSGQGLNGPAALVADNPDLAGDFEADVEDIRASFFGSRDAQVLKLSEHGAALRGSIRGALDGGLGYLGYVGHGGAAVWASENVWNSWDAASLQAQSRQPLLVTMNCLNGYFVAPAFDSLSESLLKAEGRGAIASFSPSGLSLDGPAHRYHRALVAELTSGRHERLGDAILAAQKAYAQTGLMPELLGIYHLLGDPATRVTSRP